MGRREKLRYVPCLDIDDLPFPGFATSSDAGGHALCIVVDPKGSVFALAGKCPPANNPLSSGKVCADGTIEDPVLGTKFSLRTGEVVGAWCPNGFGKLVGGVFSPVGISTFPVRLKGRSIEVQVQVDSKAKIWSREEII
jgi:nitrite reductase/ring-hydroxylating ferredoxin subunit